MTPLKATPVLSSAKEGPSGESKDVIANVSVLESEIGGVEREEVVVEGPQAANPSKPTVANKGNDKGFDFMLCFSFLNRDCSFIKSNRF